jgi:DNA replication protein DnaC
LQPFPEHHPNWHHKHGELIALMNYNPYLSYLLLGTFGKGKTTFAYCLYRRALEEGRPAIALTLAELLKQMRDFDTPCIVKLDEIRRNQERQFLLIDEFGDAGGRVTDFASASLRELISACEESNTQLVITANKDETELEAYWSQADPERGAAIMRKLKQKKGAKLVEMF